MGELNDEKKPATARFTLTPLIQGEGQESKATTDRRNGEAHTHADRHVHTETQKNTPTENTHRGE